ncbi:xylulokinase [Aquiluna borgnonia]|uniref:Xylulose kinase n=1 Tax=Aquiluna borgnonia TaxID=2499157 RepID=A0A7D4QGW2_9MICO|nr:xylulokinase [Aquiluna borgnonia]QKJ25688.1 xylulokinase [Aquiluna borgnonia]
MALVAGVDSSTQSCKVLIWDPNSRQIVREGRAKHPSGTEVDPQHWWDALLEAIESAGGLSDVSAISIAGQQHGMVLLDQDGNVLRPALLWNDTRSSGEAGELIEHFGADWLAKQTGSLPVASFTATKLRWVLNNEPEIAKQVAAVCLPHDYLSWRLSENYPNLSGLFTDRSDASGTGYFNPSTNEYLSEVIAFCLGHQVLLPRVLGPRESTAKVRSDLASHEIRIGAGMGDNAGAAKGLELSPGMFAVSLGTSGTVFGATASATSDASGCVAGFADAQGYFLPLVCTINAARVIEWGAQLLGVGLTEFGELALKADLGAGGVRVTPYLEGERTPNLPDATASVTGITLANGTRENFARACIEGMLRGLAFGGEVIEKQGLEIKSISLIGGAAANPAVQQIAKEVFSAEVFVPEPAEYVALGAAKQAAELLGK